MSDLDPTLLWKLRSDMVLMRTFEEKAGQMYGLRKIGGFCHLYNGQEAIAAGFAHALDYARDYVLTGYRDHGHALAAGMEPRVIMAELYGKITGCSRGKGGSMHLFDAQRHFLGGNGIVGAQIPVAAGVAFARAEGIVPAPEANHAVKGAIVEALRCKAEGRSEVILFNLCGHGHFDMSAYSAYFAGKLVDQPYDEAELAMALSGLPSVPA